MSVGETFAYNGAEREDSAIMSEYALVRGKTEKADRGYKLAHIGYTVSSWTPVAHPQVGAAQG